MPFSFIEIEEKKSRVIGFLFLLIIFFYFLTAYLVLFALQNAFYVYFSVQRETGIHWPSLYDVLVILAIAFLAALIHWAISTNRLIERMSLIIGARPIDEEDVYHQYFNNIVEEVSVAIGGRRIEPRVISSVSMNAFALEDFNGCAVIGVTEGLLTRLGRAQIEAVVAHEAGHIVSGDCLSTTLTCALAEIYEEILSKISLVLKKSRGKGSAFLIIYLVVGFMNLMSAFMRYFISRQREYRADAIAARLTRDPLSLAEALTLISNGWRGEGASGDKMPSIFIVNPVSNSLDEREGFFSDIFSTHPPVRNRVAVLADMAHLDGKTLQENLKNFKRVSPVAVSEYSAEDEGVDKKWYVFLNQAWAGPYTRDVLKEMEGFKPDQWVRFENETGVRRAYEDKDLLALFNQDRDLKYCCPSCRVVLEKIFYEGTPLLKCPYCAGVFVEYQKISRVLIRTDKVFDDKIQRLAEMAVEQKKGLYVGPDGYRNKNAWIYTCPKCARKMHRQFFVYSYPIEIDRCPFCGGVWFDKMELEILQYIYEHKEKFFDGANF